MHIELVTGIRSRDLADLTVTLLATERVLSTIQIHDQRHRAALFLCLELCEVKHTPARRGVRGNKQL
jgi:hypothetical protein